MSKDGGQVIIQSLKDIKGLMTQMSAENTKQFALISDRLDNLQTSVVSMETRLANLETKGTATKRAPAVKASPTAPTPVISSVPSTLILWLSNSYAKDPEFMNRYLSEQQINDTQEVLHKSAKYLSFKNKEGKTPEETIKNNREIKKLEFLAMFNVIKNNPESSKKAQNDYDDACKNAQTH